MPSPPARAAAQPAAPNSDGERPVWWGRWLARIPLPILHGVAAVIGWLAYRVFPYRHELVLRNLTLAFPEAGHAELRRIMRAYYIGFAQMLVEIIKSIRMSAEEIRRRVRVINFELPLERLSRGQTVLLVAAHQCNWEWMLLRMSLASEFPLDAAYKPLVNPWAEREMMKVRSRFGSRLVPARDLLPDMLQRRQIIRTVAMVADQEPTRSEHKHWTRFLNRDTAFYMGPEQIARVMRLPVYFIAMRRTARGYYEMQFELLSEAGEPLSPGELTERYARRVEQQIRAAPADWPWSHKRWKLKRSVYAR